MDINEEKLKRFIQENNISCEHLRFEESCHSVADAAKAANANPADFVKTICLIDSGNNLIAAIVKGEDRASTSRIGAMLNIERPRAATPEEILERTGYPCGGTPPFGFSAKFIIDGKVMEKETVYAGGGSEKSLIKISTKELVRATNGNVLKIRK